LSFSITGWKVVRETVAESSEEDAVKAMEVLGGEKRSDYHVKRGERDASPWLSITC
jgi:hypothetical protein